MNSTVASLITFASIFAAALIGMAVRRLLPEDQVRSDPKEVVRLTTALIATMSALVLGMLVSSAKSFYDARKNDVAEISSEVVTIDQTLARYGPETRGIRAEFRQMVQAGIDRTWPGESSRASELRPKKYGEVVLDQLELLTPKNDAQAAIKSQSLSMILAFRQTQWLLFLKSEQNAVPLPLLVVVVSWLAVIFASFGLFVSPNSTVVVALALGATTVSSAIFIILEMYRPFGGMLRIPPTPILDVLSELGR
jgi:hypothetical protein